MLHRAAPGASLLVFPDRCDTRWLRARRGHRAIGVVDRFEGDARGNWVPTVMGQRYDAFLSFDETHALHPLDGRAGGGDRELETFPWST